MEPGHVPVMPQEIIDFLCITSPALLVDGTSGSGGHTALLKNALPNSQILAFERDPSAAEKLSSRFNGTGVSVVNSSYIDIPEWLELNKYGPVQAVLLDLGLSSIQLDSPDRGFSHRTSGPLDMRFDQSKGKPAWEMLCAMTEKQIADVIYRYGEEGRSRAIARAIKKAGKLNTTDDLASIVRSVVKGNPVKPLARVFQAVRIHVNGELLHLEKLLSEMHKWTESGCRIAVLTFHSIEDRMIKQLFRDSQNFRQFDPPWMVPGASEKRLNPRARSARLRLGVRC
jgi:16S rRNA (cytosine1402-N4)-methyltransferase